MPTEQSKVWKSKSHDIQRGDYNRNLLTTFIFAAGRLATIPIQYTILTALAPSRSNSAPSVSPILNASHGTSYLFIVTILIPTLRSLKHATWALFISNERLSLPFALLAGLADTFYESLCTTLFTTWTVPSFTPYFWTPYLFSIGATLFFSSLFVELTAEFQRRKFRADPTNQGRLCTTGLWSITRHVNYTAVIVCGIGYGLAMGGWVHGAVAAVIYTSQFARSENGVPGLEKYCREKYGEKEWSRYTTSVRWKLVPGMY